MEKKLNKETSKEKGRMRVKDEYISRGIKQKVSPLLYNEIFNLLRDNQNQLGTGKQNEIYRYRLKMASNGAQIIEQIEETTKNTTVYMLVTTQTINENLILFSDERELIMLLDKEMREIIKNQAK